MIRPRVNDLETRQSLLGRLRHLPLDQQSWEEFVDCYGSLIFCWCRKWGLQPVDAEDVTQNVLTDLARQMGTFEYNSSGCFRSWLKTIAWRTWCDFLEKKKRSRHCSIDPELVELLQSDEVIEDFAMQIDQRAQQELMQQAMDIVRIQVQPNTWAAFEMTAIQNQPGKMVAENLGMNVGAVYVAKSKVIKHLRRQVARLSDQIMVPSTPPDTKA